MKKNRFNIAIIILAILVLVIAVWGPEKLAQYKDGKNLNQVSVEPVENPSEGYRYTLSTNEKMYILAKCLDNQVIPGSEMSSMTKVDSNEALYGELTGTYAFVVNYQGPSDKEIQENEVFERCNAALDQLKELGVMPETVKTVDSGSYDAVLYSAIDVLEPRNNLSVWKVSLSTKHQNADKTNRLLDAYIDASSGKIYEFYVRTQWEWSDVDCDACVEKWGEYLGLKDQEDYEDANPLLETTPYYQKYKFPGMDQGSTVVTVGFYEGIGEVFLKISR